MRLFDVAGFLFLRRVGESRGDGVDDGVGALSRRTLTTPSRFPKGENHDTVARQDDP